MSLTLLSVCALHLLSVLGLSVLFVHALCDVCKAFFCVGASHWLFAIFVMCMGTSVLLFVNAFGEVYGSICCWCMQFGLWGGHLCCPDCIQLLRQRTDCNRPASLELCSNLCMFGSHQDLFVLCRALFVRIGPPAVHASHLGVPRWISTF